MSYTYNYTKSVDFPGGLNISNLADEIGQCPDILVALDRIDVNGDDVAIIFKAQPAQAGKTALDGGTTQTEEHPPTGGSVLGQHDPTPHDEPLPVQLRDANADPVTVSEDGVLATVPQANTPGYRYHDRDIRLKTCIVDAATAIEDLRVDTQDGHKRKSWNEVALVGILKGDDTSGYSACADQADADANGVVSVFDFQVKDGTSTPVPYNILAGAFYVDPTLVAPKDGHRGFIVAAPNLPPAVNGSIPLMDCYLEPWEGRWIDSRSPHAMKVDPTASVEASKIRIYLFHPAGAKQTHILRFITFRPNGSW